MDTIITQHNVMAPTEHCSFTYTADASDFGWAPGYFPEELKTTLGNSLPFNRTELTSEKATYKQVGGCISLVIYND